MFTTPDPDGVSLTIGGTTFEGWQRIELSRALDNHPRAAFSAPFEPASKLFRDKFAPLSYQEVQIKIGGKPFFTGLMLTPEPEEDAESNSIAVQCYAPAGVLSDCKMPNSAFPLEFNKVKLKEIARRLCDPFGIGVVWEGDPGAVFERVALEPGDSPQQKIAELAKVRGRIVSSTTEGELYFPDLSRALAIPSARFPAGSPPISIVKGAWQPQHWFSEITAIAPKKHGRAGAQVTVKNPHYKAKVPRPHSYTVEDAEAGDLKKAADAKLARMFGDIVSWTIGNFPGLRDERGEFWEPGVSILVEAPGAMIYRESSLLVRNVDWVIEADNLTTNLGLVLPGSFTGEVPEVVPWG